MIDKKSVEEFQKIYLEEKGVRLGFKEANDLATELLMLMKLIYRPIPKKSIKK